ncbi:MAG: hypothetical protein IMZ46_00900, partial [Acidobacteria bacterium]|nr:hypothetical protein [Acidobacteriota bacterium]
MDQEQSRRREAGQDDDTEVSRSPLPAIEAAPAIDGSTSRDAGSGVTSHRRNTVGRRHSPSVASADQPVAKDKSADKGTTSKESQESLAELNEKFQQIRKEIADAAAQYELEEADFKQQEEQLRKDLESKRQALKEKESNTEQLRKRVNITGEQMRAADKERAKKEQLLRDKKAKLANTEERITKLLAEMESMRAKRESFSAKKSELDKYRDDKVAELDKENAVLQEECTKLEAELKEKGKMLKELKQERQKLPGGEADDRWKDTDLQLKKDWETQRKILDQRIMAEMQRRHELTTSIRVLHGFIEECRAQQSNLANPYLQNNTSGVELGDTNQQQTAHSHIKRLSRHSGGSIAGNGLPAHSQFPQPESSYATSGFGNRAGFAPGPYVDVTTTADSFSHDQEFSAADIRALTAGAPLSPTAHSLIPAGILGDDELPSPTRILQSPFERTTSAPRADVDPQSPTSSNQSLSIISSPHGSSQHLPFSQYSSGEPGDRRSRDLGIGSSPASSAAQPSRFTSLFSPFQRARATSKAAADTMGPPLGTLKPGQSRSFPRQTDEWDVMGNKRRINLAGGLFNRNSVHADGEGLSAGNSTLSGRKMNPSSGAQGISLMSATSRDPGSPRPASVASSELPRPSTEGGSIWGIPGESMWPRSRLPWSSDGQWLSRNPSRRPSLHGQSVAPETTLASADDEILDDEDLLNPQASPSQVGVIGSRPPMSRTMAQRLNPTAPTFMTSIFGRERPEGRS